MREHLLLSYTGERDTLEQTLKGAHSSSTWKLDINFTSQVANPGLLHAGSVAGLQIYISLRNLLRQTSSDQLIDIKLVPTYLSTKPNIAFLATKHKQCKTDIIHYTFIWSWFVFLSGLGFLYLYFFVSLCSYHLIMICILVRTWRRTRFCPTTAPPLHFHLQVLIQLLTILTNFI